jgi:hypothetical protein
VRISTIGVAFTAIGWTAAWFLASLVTIFGMGYFRALTDRLAHPSADASAFAGPAAIVVMNVIVGALGGALAGVVAEATLRVARE